MTSSELLNRMRQRNYAANAAEDVTMEASGVTNVPCITSQVDEADIELLCEVRSFVAFRASVDGEARTSELVEYFGSRLPPQDSAKFKAMLHQLCDFRRDFGIGVWQLKSEFK